MKVLHVIPGVAATYGGPSTAIWQLVKHLNQLQNTHAEIATTDADGSGGHLRNDLPQDVNVHLFRHAWSEQWKWSFDLVRWLKQHVTEFDLVHIHAMWSSAVAAAARAAERHGVPYIVRPAGMLSPYSWNHRGWKKQIYWSLVERRTIQRAAGIHATSSNEASEIKILRPEARVFVIANGVDDAAFTATTACDYLRQRCQAFAGEMQIILFLSRLHPKKGIIDLLLPAVVHMQTPCVLVIAGAADPHTPQYAQEVRRAVEQLGLTKRVIMYGRVTGNQRWTMFDGADIFVLPSHSENFGIAVAEAMARGCPVVITDTVQSCDHVTAAGAGEVVPRDVSKLAKALDQLIAQPARRRACGDAGHTYAAQHFRWQNIARQTVDMYLDCLTRCDSTNN